MVCRIRNLASQCNDEIGYDECMLILGYAHVLIYMYM